MYRMAWMLGLKTTYYLRSLAATGNEKNATGSGEADKEAASSTPQPAPVPKACSIDDPDCEACQ